jgi:hypothetical protein
VGLGDKKIPVMAKLGFAQFKAILKVLLNPKKSRWKGLKVSSPITGGYTTYGKKIGSPPQLEAPTSRLDEPRSCQFLPSKLPLVILLWIQTVAMMKFLTEWNNQKMFQTTNQISLVYSLI